ncbi:MAG: hypothetical protein JKY34_12550 [Kordiimonadaceae bacterium]|nr:hypothetical protein [Kordiimonadaceae bacterium]PCJ37775.1 MAG: hypothetical protein COA75_03370 [Cellvibrionales bacterium]
MKGDLLEKLQASDLPLCSQAHAEIVALRRALVNQARAFGRWCDGQSTSAGAIGSEGKNLER